jgi:hypothetical protein
MIISTAAATQLAHDRQTNMRRTRTSARAAHSTINLIGTA